MWFFIFGGFIACAGLHVHASCPLVMTPPTVVVAFGNPFSVNCTSLSSETDGMGWESSAGGTDLRTGVTSVPLNIKSIQDWTLEPTCYLNFKNISQCTKNLPITVYKVPDTVVLSQPSPSGAMEEGKVYVMRCDVINVAPARNLSVQWYKGNKMFHMEKFDATERSPVNKTSTVRLTADGDDNGTEIWCEATLNFYPAAPNELLLSKRKQMSVLYPPKFTKPENETVEVKPESKLLLNCTASGNPVPVYSWGYQDLLQQTVTIENGNKSEQHEPVLSSSSSRQGTYSCKAYNSQGTSTKYFTVIEEARSQKTLAAIIAAFVGLGILLFIAGYFLVTPNGSFSFNKGSYVGGQPVPSEPV